LRADSSVGAIVVAHHEQLVENEVAGVDGRWRMTPNWVAGAQVLSSETNRPEGRASTGTALRASLVGNGRTYGYQATLTDISPDFAALSGFVPRTDIRDVTQVASATLRPARRWLTSWGPKLTVVETLDHDATLLDQIIRLETQFELARSSHLSIYRSENPERLRPQDAPSLHTTASFHQQMTGVTFGAAPNVKIAFSGEYAMGRAINVSPSAGQRPDLGDSRLMNLMLSVRPMAALAVDTTAVWSALGGATGSIFTNRIIRTRWNYQITRRLSTRAIIQIDDLAADRAQSALTPRDSHTVDLLLTYLVNPGTALYVGVNSDRQNPNGPQTAQFFLKMSYAFHP
jgi:hypothetical protein